jgi:2,3-bisphosphoglycerate-independent phosphoglycerate mutase
VDLALGRLLPVVERLGGIAVVTADHGNSDEMFELDKAGAPKKDENGRIKPKTSHTLNPVPFIIFDPAGKGEYRLSQVQKPGLSSIAATCLMLLGFQPPEDYDPALIAF